MGKVMSAVLMCLAFLGAVSAVTLDKVVQDSFDFNYMGIDPTSSVSPCSGGKPRHAISSTGLSFATRAIPPHAPVSIGAPHSLNQRPQRTRISKASGLWFSN